MKGLREIQQGLKVSKGQRNKFGNYNYRSTSDILEALKPLLSEYNCSILMTDRVIQVGNRNYVEATVKLISDEGAIIETTALACEPEIQKGMAASQITGTASSYARKYALSGLFAIDDTDEVDSHDNTVDSTNPNTLSDDRFKVALKLLSEGKTTKELIIKQGLTPSQKVQLDKA